MTDIKEEDPLVTETPVCPNCGGKTLEQIQEDNIKFREEIRRELAAMSGQQKKQTEKTTSVSGYVTFFTGVFIWALNKLWGWARDHFIGN